MQPSSNEYRETQSHMHDLLDQQSGDTLQTQIDAVSQGIAKGTSTYGDLKTLLADSLDEARPNSALAKSIAKQIAAVDEQVRNNKVEGDFEALQYRYDAGQLSGGAYAKQLRAMAEPFKENDPKRYYQILQAAVALEKGGGGGGSGGTKAANALVDQAQAIRDRYQGLLAQYENGAKQGIDPSTGEIVVFSKAKIRELDVALLGTFDTLAAAYTAKGDKSAAASTQNAKVKYISESIVNHNTINANDQWVALYGAAQKVLDHALDSPDPYRARADVAALAKRLTSFAGNLGLTAGTSAQIDQSTGTLVPGTPGEASLMEQVDPNFATNATTLASALTTLSTNGIDDASASAAMEQLAGLGGSRTDGSPADNPFLNLGTRALEISSRSAGLETGDLQRIATADGVLWARTLKTKVPSLDAAGNTVLVEQSMPDSFRDPITGENKPFKVDGNTIKLVDVLVDINGKPTKIQAIATAEQIQGINGWVASKNTTINGITLIAGQALTDKQIDALQRRSKGSDNYWNIAVAQGSIQQGSVMQTWQATVPAYTDKYGKTHAAETWSEDPATNLWYKGALPIKNVERKADGTVYVDDDGRPKLSWKSFGSSAGVPIIYSGSDAKAAQDAVNADRTIGVDVRSRGINGEVSDEPYDKRIAYYNPAQAQLTALQGESWWSAEKRQARVEADRMSHIAGVKRMADASKDDAVVASQDPSGVSDLAGKLGINLNGTQPTPFTLGGPRARKADEKYAGLGDFMAQQKTKTSSVPTVKLPDARKRASGPALAPQIDVRLPTGSSAFVPRVRPIEPEVPVAPAVKTPAPTKPSAPVVKSNRRRAELAL
jgi:hypothetical protein